MRGGGDVGGEETAGETYGSLGRMLFDTSWLADWVTGASMVFGGSYGDKPWLIHDEDAR